MNGFMADWPSLDEEEAEMERAEQRVMTSNVIAWPGSPQHREAEATKLERLEQMEADLSRPIVELAREVAYLRGVAEAARKDMAKVAEHERRGYKQIAVGAFQATRDALERKP